MEKFLDEYINQKVTISGKRVESVCYSTPIKCNFKREHQITKDKTKSKDKLERNLARARKNVRQLIWTNLTPHTKFLTLTTKDTILDVKEFRRHLQTFLQEMTRAGYPLSYLYVLERQKERGLKEGNIGSLHAHLVVFNNEYIPIDIIQKNWHYGNANINILNGLRQEDNEKIKDVASYVCKYITKDSVAEFNQRTYNYSKNLYKPYEINITSFSDGIITFQNDNICQQFASEVLSTSCITYKASKVITNEDKTFYQVIDYQQGVI